jgi:hypothetical protein
VAASLLLSANLNIMYAGASGFAKRHLLLPSPGPVPCTHVLIGDASLIVLSGREPSSAKFIRDSGLIMDSWIYGQSAWVVARGYISRLDGRHGRASSSFTARFSLHFRDVLNSGATPPVPPLLPHHRPSIIYVQCLYARLY